MDSILNINNMVAENIKKILSNRPFFQNIKRFEYTPYQIEIALKTVLEIGKIKSPEFVIDGQNKFLFTNLVRWVHGDKEFKCQDENGNIVPGDLTKGLYIAGNTGSGKSWAMEIISAYALIDNVMFEVNGEKKPLQWVNYHTTDICREFMELGSIERFNKIPVLGLQDLASDAEPREVLYMGNRVSVLKQILDYRGDRNDRLTLITSNIPINNDIIRELYGDRAQSRLKGMCNYFMLKGKDRRI